MLWGLDLGFVKDIVEGDTLSIIRKLKRDDEDKSKIGAFIRDGKGLKRRVQFCLQDGVLVFFREEVDRDRRREGFLFPFLFQGREFGSAANAQGFSGVFEEAPLMLRDLAAFLKKRH
ncbi:hypothetical protein Gohar_028217 [Gossypium harknessii]|uniref:Uncharacterized protein n=1 Tax=Gossypium harknessii TaxID=34285 RepID=A0A7J9IBY3_9ROSI|nr:hypothetical protein [Gossypium harknessii]